ncbi:MAG: SufE family protein [Pseudomonadaceae bacterium]|nr:SufE family protein [Pseudomonadaceae bacterium]
MTSLDDIRDSFEFFDDWEDKYRFLLDLGRELPAMSDELKTDDNIVRGCQSQVWLHSQTETTGDSATKKLVFDIDSDAHIVRGLIAIVLAALNERTPREILDTDIEALFAELDLLSHLSATRGNGLRAMVGRVREVAAQTETQSG